MSTQDATSERDATPSGRDGKHDLVSASVLDIMEPVGMAVGRPASPGMPTQLREQTAIVIVHCQRVMDEKRLDITLMCSMRALLNMAENLIAAAKDLDKRSGTWTRDDDDDDDTAAGEP